MTALSLVGAQWRLKPQERRLLWHLNILVNKIFRVTADGASNGGAVRRRGAVAAQAG